MSYLRTFAPWIVYALIPSAHWNWAALIALVLSIGLVAQQTRAGRTLDAQIIELGSAVFFAAVTVLAFTSPDSGLHPYTPALSSATLALIAGISLAVRKPFTLGIAKQTTPREFWDQPLFVRTNVIITAVWTACFAVTAVALAALADSGSTARTLVQVAGFVVPMVFTLRYVAHIQAKAAQLRTH
ncbi:hypothetical protein EV138_2954 [Kribbella voronezhensis]|uniref:Intracellular septation protein A n=1 Tax=Kribbella voronezhensis TaxID=2512212 RepID=A0A4R7TCF2_9ACTN|nr:hypothetical protein [Kribbella voronezhensis]TDU89389.1 hypothetical protein EV138_2954 [Kribbella voronezhensis]